MLGIQQNDHVKNSPKLVLLTRPVFNQSVHWNKTKGKALDVYYSIE